MPRTCNAPVPVGAGALLCLRAGEVALGWGAGLVTTDSRGGAGLGYRVVGEAPVTPAGDLAGGGQRGSGAGAYNGQVYS